MHVTRHCLSNYDLILSFSHLLKLYEDVLFKTQPWPTCKPTEIWFWPIWAKILTYHLGNYVMLTKKGLLSTNILNSHQKQENKDFPPHFLGTVCFWKQNMECTRVHNLETSHLTPIYCTDMVILPNVNHIAVCTSESDIRFFELSGNGSLVCVGSPIHVD